MQEDNVTRTVSATVKTKTEAEDGYQIELDIPAFKSKWPTKLTRVSAELAAQLTPGETKVVVLGRESPKKDGASRDYEFYWGLLGFSDEPPEPASTGQGQAPASGRDHSDPTRTSIERQKSLDIADRGFWAWSGTELPPFKECASMITAIAKVYEAYLATGKIASGDGE